MEESNTTDVIGLSNVTCHVSVYRRAIIVGLGHISEVDVISQILEG